MNEVLAAPDYRLWVGHINAPHILAGILHLGAGLYLNVHLFRGDRTCIGVARASEAFEHIVRMVGVRTAELSTCGDVAICLIRGMCC